MISDPVPEEFHHRITQLELAASELLDETETITFNYMHNKKVN